MTAPTIDGLAAALAQAEARIADQDRQIRELHHQVTHDDLTGLLNRAGLIEAWSTTVDHSQSIALLDVDHFKQINDTYGHATGDQVLQRIADAIDGRWRITARLGGDELVIVDRTDRIADLAHDPLLCRVPAGGRVITVTVTAGLTQAVSSLGVALARADLALYRAKARRRGLTQWWSGAIDGDPALGSRPRVRLRDTRAGAR